MKKRQKWHRKEDMQLKMWYSITHSNSSRCFFLQLNLPFLASHKTPIILQRATRKTHPRAYQCISGNYIIFAQKCYHSTSLSIWVVFTHTFVSKNAIVSIMPFSTSFGITWYAEAAIHKFLSKWHTFWMAPWLICYLIVFLFRIERTWLVMRNIANVLPLKLKLSRKIQRFSAIGWSMKMMKNSWISKNLNSKN